MDSIKRYRLLVFLFFVGVFAFQEIHGQRLLQLEIFREVEAVKFGEGSTITFKTTDFPADWQTRKIDRIITGDDILIFDDGMVPLSHVTHFRVINGTASAFGKLFLGFGAGWFLFGGAAHLFTDFVFSWGSFAIGAVAVGLGWLLNKVIAKKTYKMGKNANLRIIDISFPSPNMSTSGNGYP